MSLVTGLFSPVLYPNQRRSPPLRLPVSDCRTFRIMCDVPSIAVFCRESIECLPGMASRFYCKPSVTIPVAPVVTGVIVHFRFHIRCVSIHKLLYFSFFSTSCFAQNVYRRVLSNLSVCMFSHFCFSLLYLAYL
jgi:hypothetical protein